MSTAKITITRRAATLTNREAPQLYRIYQRIGAVLHERGQATGQSVCEALRAFDGRSSWHNHRVGPYRFQGCGKDYLLEPVYLRREVHVDPVVTRKRYFRPVRELVQRGLLIPA